ncbi:MAG: TerB family tellurite resistance protein [Bacteroidia bacterium]|nr:TerB family tellurite resistance protein [Bacteroidia bacterium]
MEQESFNQLLLKTAFSCMACDGEIDNKEIEMIRKMHSEKQIFGDINLNEELTTMVVSINNEGHGFLKMYFQDLTNADLSEAEELKIIETAIDTIKADDKIEYSEIKFFKVIKSKLKISNDLIMNVHPDFEEYLEDDIISPTYLSTIQSDFFNSHSIPEFRIF